MDFTPEKKYPAEHEDVDTIIEGKDGRDYVVDVVDGMKKWVLYVRDPNDIVIEKKIVIQPANTYQSFLKEMTEKLKVQEPDLPPVDRLKKIQHMWRESKSNRK